MSKVTKIIYAILFLLLILQPHFARHTSILPRQYLESIGTVVILLIAYVTYYFNKREIRQKVRQLKISEDKLIESFKYIGLINRRLPLLKKITSDLLSRPKVDKKGRRAIFEDLLATAVVSIAKAPWGLFRFIDMHQTSTTREFMYNNGHYILLRSKVSNKELLEARNGNRSITSLDDIHIISTSDSESATQCILIFPKNDTMPAEADIQVLRAIVDQAQLFFKYLYI